MTDETNEADTIDDRGWCFNIDAFTKRVKGGEGFEFWVRLVFGISQLSAETSDGTRVDFQVALRKAFFSAEPEETSRHRVKLDVDWRKLPDKRLKVQIDETAATEITFKQFLIAKLKGRLGRGKGIDAALEAGASYDKSRKQKESIKFKVVKMDPQVVYVGSEGNEIKLWAIKPIKGDHLNIHFNLNPDELFLVAHDTISGAPNQPASVMFTLFCLADDLHFPTRKIQVHGNKASLWNWAMRKANKRKLAEAALRQVLAKRLGWEQEISSKERPNREVVLAQKEVELPHDEDS